MKVTNSEFFPAAETITKVGLPTVLLSSVTTLALVCQLRTRKIGQGVSLSVHMALMTNCAIYTIFAIVHYMLIVLAGQVPALSDLRVILLGISQTLAGVGVTVRSVMYLKVATMRAALKKSIRNFKCSSHLTSQ
ncbi:uncharacterized protein LOC142352909 [Convolutriloba macropyga]|uniref:uncharacterized protein LOC142352909 n=1 Tax=Convolutriloba macropyga TaxID=536237 RepID=UPI003F5228A5